MLSATPAPTADLIPARMLNEFAYCPRLAYLEWIQGEWAENTETIDGSFVHRNVDREDRRPIDAPENDDEELDSIHARSLRLESETLGLVAVADIVEVDGLIATPVDYKRGPIPKNAEQSWEPERVQLAAIALLLQEAGYQVTEGIIYYAQSKKRIKIPFSWELLDRTKTLIREMRALADSKKIPLPLVDSPKCPKCSLVGICLPDETTILKTLQPTKLDSEESIKPKPARMLLAPIQDARPIHVFEQGAKLGKSGDRIIVEHQGDRIAAIPMNEISQISIFGGVQITTQALAELIDRDIPVCYFTLAGWFRGISNGLCHRNIEVRIQQFAHANDPTTAVKIAGPLIQGKILNCRTLLRRNLENEELTLEGLKQDARNAIEATTLETLLGIEGFAAKRYFANFAKLIKADFEFTTRNRRPPTDPVNAVLSFLYSMLTKECHIAALSAGLDPMLGFLHQPRYGRPSLALDLAEEFRPIIADSLAITLFNTQELREEHFVRKLNACALTQSGRKIIATAWERKLTSEIIHPIFGYSLSYRRVIVVQARLLTRYLLQEIPQYPPFRTR